jgi:hypothetical protein
MPSGSNEIFARATATELLKEEKAVETFGALGEQTARRLFLGLNSRSH